MAKNSWYETIRRIARFVILVPDEAFSVYVAEDKRDYLSRSQPGDFVGNLGIEDGPHWRFDQEDTLGSRFLVKGGIVVEKQTAYASPDGRNAYRVVETATLQQMYTATHPASRLWPVDMTLIRMKASLSYAARKVRTWIAK